jgi:hypothetical protein
MTTRLPALECLCQRTGAVRLTTRVLNFFWLHAALSPISTNESDRGKTKYHREGRASKGARAHHVRGIGGTAGKLGRNGPLDYTRTLAAIMKTDYPRNENEHPPCKARP